MEENHIRLRAVEPEDVDFMMECEEDRDSAKWSDYRAPLSRNQLLTYALTYDSDPFAAGQLRLIAVGRSGERIGIADLYDISEKDSKAFAGVTIHPAWRGKGMSRPLIEAMHSIAFERLGLKTLAVKISTRNTGALTAFEKAGYHLTAFLPSWHRIGKDFHDFKLLTMTATDN